MNFYKQLITAPPLALAIALSFPCNAQAINIGDIVLQSRLGEPLLAHVDLIAGGSENIENNCLSLTAPDPHEDDVRDYLTKARLSIKSEGGRQYVLISTYQPFNEPYAKLRLQVKCPGMGSVIKTLTILPDLDESIFQSLTTTFDLPAIADSTPSSSARRDTPAAAKNKADSDNMLPQPRHSKRKSARSQPSAEFLQVAGQDVSGKAAQSLNEHRASDERRAPPARRVRNKQDDSSTFRLKLSGEPFDESRLGKISPAEREILLARQKLLDADDQTASFLTLQHQVKQLQDELGEIKQKLAAVPGATSNIPPPAVALTQTTAQPDPNIQRGIIAIGLIVAMLALWLGLRYYTRRKSQQAAAPILKQPASIPSTPVAARSTYTQVKSPAAATAATAPAAAQLGVAVSAATPPRPPPANEAAELTDEDSVLEEAELYAEHGHPDKAITILQAELAQYPAHAEAWVLLLSIFSSLGKAAEFEQTAQSFIALNPHSDSWKSIQALGRTLDPGNALYASDEKLDTAVTTSPQDAPRKQRPIGDILVGMGALSGQDLQDCLLDFDSKVHGRFGGYLISRRMITLAQLNDALLQQQSGTTNTEAAIQPAADAPTAQAAPDKGLALDTEFSPRTEKPQPLDLEFVSSTADIQPLHIEFDSPAEKPQVQDLDFDFEPPAAEIQGADLTHNELAAKRGKVQGKR